MEDETLTTSSEVARGTAWSLLGNLIVKAAGFFYVIYVARTVAQQDVGAFYLSLGILGFFGAWRDLGLPSALIRYVPYFEGRRQFAKIKDLFKYTLAINSLIGIALTAAVWMAADWIADFYKNALLADALRFLCFFMLIESVFKVGNFFLQGRRDIKSMQMMTSLQNVLKLVFTVAFFELFGASLFWLSAAFLLSHAVSIAWFSPKIISDFRKTPYYGDGLSFRDLLLQIAPFGLVLSIIQMISFLVAYSDRLMIGYFFSPEHANQAIAIYSLATLLAVNLMVFPGSVGNIFMPMVSRLFAVKKMDSIRKVMATSQRWMLFATLPFAIVMMGFAGEMITILYGEAYSGGASAMLLFTAGLLFSSFTYTIALTLAGMRLVNLEFKIVVLMGITNVVLNFLLIPIMGIDGAALASALSFALASALFIYYGKKIIGFEPPFGAYKIVAAALVVLAIIYLLKPTILSVASALPIIGSGEAGIYLTKVLKFGFIGLIVAVSGGVFAALCLALRCFEKEDVAIMERAARKAKIPEIFIGLANRIVLYGIPKERRR
ncbi:MAG: oligosaccharide flippase family protein [Candidatus Micrarchaeota archaeon]|nr:oligosaccharide flippase family protein [Candidatus Micrarchaeota archaeon]